MYIEKRIINLFQTQGIDAGRGQNENIPAGDKNNNNDTSCCYIISNG